MIEKINLFIVGAPKCGTTSLYSYLTQHERIGGGKAKEPHYFSKDFENFRWFNDITSYHDNYDFSIDLEYRVDSSVMYFYSTLAPKEIYSYNPNAKIIVMLRDEVDFYLSYHNQNLYNRDEVVDCPNKAWRLTEQRNKGNSIPKSCREPSFLDYKSIVNFKPYLDEYYKYFDNNQILVIPFKPWINNLDTYQNYIFSWLGLDNDVAVNFDKINEKRAHKYKLVASLTNGRNPSLLGISKFLKAIFRIKKIGLAPILRKLNTKKAEYKKLDNDVIQEISSISDSNKTYLSNKFLQL